MKNKLVGFLICLLLILTPILSASQTKDNSLESNINHYKEPKQNPFRITDFNPKLTSRLSASMKNTAQLSIKKEIHPMDYWDILLTIEINQSNFTAGVGADEEYIYAPEWNGSNIYYYDFDGVYQGSFTISGVSNICDLAYDHDTGHMWGGNGSGTCWEMDFTDKTLESTITGSWQCRAIAYVEDDDTLYVSGWGDPVWHIEKDGSEIENFNLALTTSTYGFAYDRWDESAPILWVHDQGGTGSEIRAFQLEDEEFLAEEEGYYYDVTGDVPGGIAGGLCFSEYFEGNNACTIIAGCQATTDTVVAYEYGFGCHCPDQDISVKSIDYPESGYADDDLKMQATFKNNGNSTLTTDAQMTIITTNETGEVIFIENFSTKGTGPNGLPENWTTDWWKWSNCSGTGGASVYKYDQYNGGDYYDNYITSPKINCSGLEKVTLSFAINIDMYYSSGYFYIKFRQNESNPWRDITPWENPVSGDIIDRYEISIYAFQHGGDIGSEFQFNFSYIGYYYYFNNICLDDVKLKPYNISAEYAEIVEDITIPVGKEKTVEFPSWTPSLWQNESYENTYEEYLVKAEALIDDDITYNNIKHKLIELYFPWMDDVAALEIQGFGSGPAQTFEMDGIIKNVGQNKECCFKTYMEITETEQNITEYNDSIYIESIEPQDEQELNFDNWTPAFLAEETTDQKTYKVKMWTALEDPSDRNPANDLYEEEIELDFFHDVEVTCIPSLEECNEESELIFYQRIYTPSENWIFYTSSSHVGDLCDDDWYHHEKPIGTFGVIGLSLVYPWSACNDPSMEFKVIIYEGGSTPGAEIQTVSNVTPENIIDTRMTYSSYGNALEWQFGAKNGLKPVVNETGWISVQSTYSSMNCNFLWGAGPDGNFNARQNGTGLNTNLGMNLSICGCDHRVYVPSGTQDIDVNITNIGTFPEYDMTCYAEIYEYITNCTNGTLVYEDNITGIDLPDPLGGLKQLHFNDYNFANEGAYQIIINLKDDNDDNEKNNAYSLMVGVDDTPPVSYHLLNPPEPDGDNGYYVSDVEIKICANDPEIGCGHSGSGVKGFNIRIDGSSSQFILGNCITFIVDNDGNSVIIEYGAVDTAGNEESIKTFTISMDQTVPVADDIAWEAYKEGRWWNVDLTAHATDATSEMDRVEYFINDGHQETIEGDGPDYVFTIQWSETLRNHMGWFYHYDRAGNVIPVNFSFAVVESAPQSKSHQFFLINIKPKTNQYYTEQKDNTYRE